MLSRIPHIHLLSACLTLLTALMLPSCINDDEMCPSGGSTDPADDAGMVIEFTMVTREASGTGSRALLSPSDPTMIGTMAENYLDLDNILFLLFDDKQTLLRVFTPDIEPENTANYIRYTVRTFLNDKYFLEPTPDVNGNITFTIVVVGNYSGLGSLGIDYHPGMKLSEIFDPAKVATFTMPLYDSLNSYANNGEFKWIPSIGNITYNASPWFQFSTTLSPAYIPMAGMQTYTVSVEALKSSNVNRPVLLSETEAGDINMLRAMAKIEIIDKIGIVNGTQLPKTERTWLEKAELLGYTTRGSILPTFDQWKVSGTETQYVTKPSVPANSQYIGYQPISGLTTSGPSIQFYPDFAASEEAGYTVLSCYLTEYDVTKLNGQYPMWVRITAHDAGNGSGDSASREYELRLAKYDEDNVPGENFSILRNNIYRYAITGIATGLDLDLIVEPWDLQTVEWSYTDNPSMTDDGYLQWLTGTVNPQQAVVQVSTANNITGTFTFATPEKGRWIATLMPVNQNTSNGDFMFIDSDGEPVEQVEGEIDGSPATITIKAMNPALTDQDREMRLVFTVYNTVDGRYLNADVLAGHYGNHSYFTIKQIAAQ